jgi:hypothetical protein
MGSVEVLGTATKWHIVAPRYHARFFNLLVSILGLLTSINGSNPSRRKNRRGIPVAISNRRFAGIAQVRMRANDGKGLIIVVEKIVGGAHAGASVANVQ